MKKYLIMMVAMVVATMSYAQNSLVATLTHGDEIKMFYGIYALQKAHAAAANGNIINLSGGSFQAVNITKAITLRGTGIDNLLPTYITNDFTIDIPASTTERLSMEGLYYSGGINIRGTLTNGYFLKCKFWNLYGQSNTMMKNAMFVNCKQSGTFYLDGESSVQFKNSYVSSFSNESENSSTASFINCIIYPRSDSHPDYIKNSQLINCI